MLRRRSRFEGEPLKKESRLAQQTASETDGNDSLLTP